MAKVLVVDDNPANRELTVTLLRYHGYEALEAEDGAQGLEMLRFHGADLIISDILMPTMDGYEFVQAMRSDPLLAATKVVFCTAIYREREAQRLAQSCGVHEILVKPFEAEELLRVVERALRSAEAPASSVGTEFAEDHRRLLAGKVSEQTRALQAALSRLAALHDLNLRLSSERDMQVLLSDVCRGARELIGARYAVTVVREKFDPKARHFAHSGIPATIWPSLECPPLERGICGVVMAERRARRALNPSGDPAGVGLTGTYPSVHAVLIAPVVSLTYAYGWICLADKLGEIEFSDSDERALAILAAQVGRIYENASLYTEVQRHAQALEIQIAERNRAMEEQRESELRFRQLAENIEDAFWICTADYRRLLYVSPSYEQIWGRKCEQLYGGAVPWTQAIHEEDRAMVHTELMQRAADGSGFSLDYRIVRPDGAVRWVSDRAFPIRGDDGRIYRVAGVSRDITERKAQEETIRRLTRLYAVLSGVNSMIMRIRNRRALFQELCRIAVTEGEFNFVWIGVFDPLSGDGELVASFGGSGDPFTDLPLTTQADRPGSIRPGSMAARTRAQVIVNDVAADPSLAPLHARFLERKLLALAAIPIISGGQTVAVMGFGASRRNFFDSAAMALLGDLAADVTFGLEYIAKEEKLAYLAVYDVLTGLPNSTLFLDRLGQLLRSATGAGRVVAVVLLDLYRFKQINDTLGRHVGDALLRRVADRLSEAMPPAACVARLNADSYAVAVGDLPHGEDAAARLLESLMGALREPIIIDEHQINVTFHAGIALGPEDGEEPVALFRNAEAALRRARSLNETFLFYSSEINATVMERVTMEAKLRRAIERQEFTLHYQPKVDTRSSALVGIEALLRWNDPDGGMVMPSQFIPLLEETGLIVPAGRAVIEMALTDSLRWRRQGFKVPRVAVNVSELQLRQRDFAHSLQEMIGRSGLEPPALELELTESTLMVDIDNSARTLRSIHDTGVHIAIDDFGTGYSSLRYLAKLPIGTVKIDRSFIASMVEDPDSMTIVSSIISLAHSLKLQVCAEGVETVGQSERLHMLECDTLQGYLYGRPMSAQALQPWLQRGAPPATNGFAADG
jgi:diguanylate cyclase (GGDEF)-like protein/PAS domain S-box-containing protein